VNVSFDDLALRVLDIELDAAAIRLPRCDPHGILALAQVLNNASPETPGSAANGYNAPHGSTRYNGDEQEVAELYPGNLVVIPRPHMSAGSSLSMSRFSILMKLTTAH